MNRPRNYNIIIILVLLNIAVSSCGLYDYPFLEAPNVTEFQGAPGIAAIYNRTDNDPDVFLGYEIYYKFYDKTGFTSQHQSDYNTIFSRNNPEPPDLININFRRVNTERFVKDKTLIPMIPVLYSDRNDSFIIEIILENTTSNFQVVYEKPGYEIKNLYRAVIANPGDEINQQYYKSFLIGVDGIVSADADVPSDNVALSLFIFSYGKYDLVYNIYSRPVWLGFINY